MKESEGVWGNGLAWEAAEDTPHRSLKEAKHFHRSTQHNKMSPVIIPSIYKYKLKQWKVTITKQFNIKLTTLNNKIILFKYRHVTSLSSKNIIIRYFINCSQSTKI